MNERGVPSAVALRPPGGGGLNLVTLANAAKQNDDW